MQTEWMGFASRIAVPTATTSSNQKGQNEWDFLLLKTEFNEVDRACMWLYQCIDTALVYMWLFISFVFLLVVNSLHQTHTSNVIQLASIRFYAWKHFLSFFCFAHHNDGEEVNRGRICGLTEGSGSTQKKVIESLWLLLLLDVARAKLKTENGSTNSDWRKWHSVNAMRGDWACLLIYSCFFFALRGYHVQSMQSQMEIPAETSTKSR